MKKLIVIVLALSAFACAHVNSVSLTSIPSKRGQPVTAQASKMIFLGFNFNNDFINDMSENLKHQCDGGKVSGILTKDETISYFLFFVYEKRVTATGYCLKGNQLSMTDYGVK